MDYNVLRKLVANCVEGRGDDPHFRLNTFKLDKKVQPLGLIPLVYKDEYVSKRVTPDDMPLLTEYFKEDKVMWFDSSKTFLTISFIRMEDMDPRLNHLLFDVQQAKEHKPERLPDDVKPVHGKTVDFGSHREEYQFPLKDLSATVAEIMGTYPCLNCIVGKWVKPDKISLNIRFRANSLLIATADADKKEDV